MSDKTKVITGKVRLSYAHIWEPYGKKDNDKKYSAMILIPKTDGETLLAIKEAIKTAYIEGADKLKGKGLAAPALGAIKNPLHDGDDEHPGEELYAGMMFLNAGNRYPIKVKDLNNTVITDHAEIYSGVYVNASIEFYAYNKEGGKGISASLRAIRKLEDGEKLGGDGSSSADHDFDNI